MPEIGATRLAGDFKSMMADVRKAIEESKGTVRAAANELKAEIVDGAKAAAKAIRQEATTVREGYAELLGNKPPDEETKTETHATNGKTDPAPGVPDNTMFRR